MGDIGGPVKEESSERVEALERALATLREDYEVANILLGLSGALAEVRSVKETLDRAVRTIPGLFGAEQSLVAQWEPEMKSFTISHSFGYDDEEQAELRTRSSSGPDPFPFMRRSIEERAPVFASDEPEAPGAVIAIPLFRWEKDFGALRIEFGAPREFTTRDRDLARGIAHQLGQALNNARRFGLLEGLRSFASSISEKVRYGQVVEQVLTGAASLLDADGAWIYTIDGSTGSFVSTAGLEGGLSLPERLARVSLKDVSWSQVLDGQTVSWDEGSADFYSPVPLSLTVTPLATQSGVFGALMVVNKRPPGLGPDDQEAFRVLATQGAQALENSRRFERERSVAHSLQKGLLKTEQPEMKGCDFAAIYRPADGEADIGGDFYDLIDLPNGRLGLVVGDVSGKGAEAAAQTAMVKYMLRAFAIQDESPATTLYRLNNALARDMSEDRFITLVYASFDPDSRRCSIAGAGHPPSLIYRGDRGGVDRFDPMGPLMGVFENETFGQTTTDIFPGDVFVAYTDGLIEARTASDFFGEERVEAYVTANHALPAAQLASEMYEEARRFGTVHDDTIVMVLASRSSK